MPRKYGISTLKYPKKICGGGSAPSPPPCGELNLTNYVINQLWRRLRTRVCKLIWYLFHTFVVSFCSPCAANNDFHGVPWKWTKFRAVMWSQYVELYETRRNRLQIAPVSTRSDVFATQPVALQTGLHTATLCLLQYRSITSLKARRPHAPRTGWQSL